ncbi:MAG: hypothetical protein ACPGJS_23990, partial [Flammeovirgaceae bacterium]
MKLTYHPIKKSLILCLCTLLNFSAIAQTQTEGYLIRYNLNNITKDKLSISIIPPKVQEKTIDYVMPAVIPGSYAKKDFGRFIERFRAFGK